jgi:hypothetical protein
VSARHVAGAFVLAWILRASLSFAGDSAMVLDFEGKKTKPVYDRVIKALKKADVTLQTPGADAKSAKGDAHKLGTVGTKRHVTIFVQGGLEVSKKGAYTLHLTARAGATGEELGDLSLEAPKLPALMKKIDEEVPDFVRTQLSATAPTPAPEASEKEAKPEPEAKPEKEKPKHDDDEKAEDKEKKDEPAEDKPHGPLHRPSALSVALEGRVFSRRFSYNQDVNANLRPYKVGPAPTVFAALGWYPGAHVTDGVAANIGLVADIEQSLATSSVLDQNNKKYSTSMLAYSLGLKWRIPFDAHELGISARYGRHAFIVDSDTDPNAVAAGGTAVKRDFVPDVAYQYIRPALDARFGFGPFGVGAYVGYRLVLSAGDVQKDVWFPNAKVSALDAGLFVSYEFVKSLHALAGFDIRRYGYDMHSSPSDLTKNRDVAGGAIDQYLAGFLGIEWRLPGD